MKSVGERANGKPGPLRPCSSLPLGDRKSSFQSQTGSQALSDTIPPATVQRWEDQFQSQTGSQALSDGDKFKREWFPFLVSIPNGKPGPLRRSPADTDTPCRDTVSIPNGKPGPLRLCASCNTGHRLSFQSQTGSQALSDTARQSGRRKETMFQSQTGSQALSDQDISEQPFHVGYVSIPNGKPGPLRLGGDWNPLQFLFRFNPKREARPSQT